MREIVMLAGYAGRLLLAFLALLIVLRCFLSMVRQIRTTHPLIMLFDTLTNEKIPVLYWENSIGRSRHSDIVLKDATVSRDHAVLLRRDEGWMISDTNSKAGVLLNGHKINGRRKVYINDVITLGATSLVLRKCAKGDEQKLSWWQRHFTRKKMASPYSLLAALTLFQLICAFELCVADGRFNYPVIVPFGALIFASWGFWWITCGLLKRVSFELETLALFLSTLGIALICSDDVSAAYVQIIAILLGIAFFCFLVWFLQNPDRVMKWRMWIYAGAVLLFVLNLCIGTVQHGAQNWIIIGGVSVQPSEFIKVAFIFVGASTLEYLQTAKNLTGFILFSAICIGALFLMGDFGTACVFFVTFLILSFMRSGDIRTLVLVCAAAALGAFIILKFKPYVANRFAAWRHAWEYPDTLGYQQTRVLTYSASGGLFGMGLGQGNLKYVFASTSDLVFGMMCEELGIFIAMLSASCMGGLALYARKASAKSRSALYYISACSAAGLLVFQSCLNIFGATDILPLTGVTLPFISMGGSSMIAVWGLLAFIKAADERTYALRR